MKTIQSEFTVRDRVYIDGCKQLIGIVTAVQYRNETTINYEVSWVSNGDSKANIIEGWRLSPAKMEDQ